VGSYTNSSGSAVNLAEGWNGSEWQIQPVESPAGAVQAKLQGISCTALGACMAVGWSKQSTGNAQPLAELWNGSEWLVWAAPSPSSEGGELLDISCVSLFACEAAGTYTNSSKVQVPLAEGLGAPGASTHAASNLTESSATVSGLQWLTTYRFEYGEGETTTYTSSIPVPDAHLPSEGVSEEVKQLITGLKAGTTYHFRLVATNYAGTTYSEDRKFTTP
jgi:hypothetical protein